MQAVTEVMRTVHRFLNVGAGPLLKCFCNSIQFGESSYSWFFFWGVHKWSNTEKMILPVLCRCINQQSVPADFTLCRWNKECYFCRKDIGIFIRLVRVCAREGLSVLIASQ